MKLGLNVGFLTSANPDPVPLAVEADELGYDSVWTAEAWGSDAVSLLAWIGAKTKRIGLGTAILQLPSRSPALVAMTAATLDRLSGGRLLLGLGVSGPQVIEGWHGVAYGKPLARTREAVAIIRQALERDAPLTHDGETYQIPYPGGTGLGKPLKMMMAPARADLPIYLAAIGPKNVALTAEIADGWLPIFYAPRHRALFQDALSTAGDKPFDVAPTVHVVIGDDLDRCRNAVKPTLALYVGGMGAKGKNFYNDLARRYGYEDEAARIQDLYLDGKKREAIAAVPDALVDDVALCGSRERIQDKLAEWRDADVTTLLCTVADVDTLRTMASIRERL